jgi:hypothetical protein
MDRATREAVAASAVELQDSMEKLSARLQSLVVRMRPSATSVGAPDESLCALLAVTGRQMTALAEQLRAARDRP